MGILNRGCVDTDFVRACIEEAAHVIDTAHATTNRKRDKHLRSNGLDDRQNQTALVRAGRNVQKSQFVGTLGVVASCDLDGVTGVAQLEKIHTFDHTAGVYVEAGDDTFG